MGSFRCGIEFWSRVMVVITANIVLLEIQAFESLFGCKGDVEDRALMMASRPK